MDHIFGDECVVIGGGVVVDNSGVGSSPANGFKTGSLVVFLLASEFVHVLGCLVVIDLVLFGSPGPEFSHGNSVNQMASSESVHLFLTSNCPVKSYPLPLDGLLVQYRTVDVVVEGRFMNEGFLFEYGLIGLNFYLDF